MDTKTGFGLLVSSLQIPSSLNCFYSITGFVEVQIQIGTGEPEFGITLLPHRCLIFFSRPGDKLLLLRKLNIIGQLIKGLNA
jgi:hypothetical protein